MAKLPLRDVVVVIPGIMGSVLEKNGEPLWAVFANVLATVFGIHAFSLPDLMLGDDDPEEDDLGDGVEATGLIPNSYLVGGLVKMVDGYAPLVRALQTRFVLDRGNFVEFPYDWRRDNRVSARKLKRLVDRLLEERKKVDTNARVILLAHSMGGLVASYYLEVLDGRRDVRALITFGTPFRGSINALGYLANGYKAAGRQLVDAVRSFTSAYQLLPIYAALRTDTGFQRVAEVDGIPNVSRARAEQALQFHRKIERAWRDHSNDPAHLKGYELLPIIGTQQLTLQSACLDKRGLTVSCDRPPVIEATVDGGDGTVPRASAIPISHSEGSGGTFYAQKHDSLQADPFILHDAIERIAQMQSTGLARVRGQPLSIPGARASISVELDDVYARGEPVTVCASVVDAEPALEEAGLEISIASAGGPASPTADRPASHRVVMRGGKHVVEGLPPGLYRVEVAAAGGGPGSPAPVQALFAVDA